MGQGRFVRKNMILFVMHCPIYWESRNFEITAEEIATLSDFIGETAKGYNLGVLREISIDFPIKIRYNLVNRNLAF